jgi:hypothetical protein
MSLAPSWGVPLLSTLEWGYNNSRVLGRGLLPALDGVIFRTALN